MALVECDFMISSCLNSSVTILAYSSGMYCSQLFPVHKYTCVDALQSFQSARWALRSCRLYMRRSTNFAPVHTFDISSSESGNFSPFINTFTCTSERGWRQPWHIWLQKLKPQYSNTTNLHHGIYKFFFVPKHAGLVFLQKGTVKSRQLHKQRVDVRHCSQESF